MRRVFRLVNRNIVFDERLGEVFMGKGNIRLKVEKVGDHLYVPATSENRKLLTEHREAFITGDLKIVNDKILFSPEYTMKRRQIILPRGFKSLDIKVPALKDEEGKFNLSRQIGIICSLIEKHEYFRDLDMVCEYFQTREDTAVAVELYHCKIGSCYPVDLVDREVGIIKLAITHDYKESMYVVSSLRKYTALEAGRAR